MSDLSTADGLRYLDPKLAIKVTVFGATLLGRQGWSGPGDLPAFKSLGDLVSFLDSVGEIGLVEFEVAIAGLGSVSSHDDSECHFELTKPRVCFQVLRHWLPGEHYGKIVNALETHQGLYLCLAADGEVLKFASFEHYLANRDPECLDQG